MYQIQNISKDPKQRQTLVLPDGTLINISMYFCPLQQCWFMPSLTYKDFALYGMKIVNSPNILHQYRNEIPFGLACFTVSEREPSLLEDFSSQTSRLFILTEDEVDFYSEVLTGQV